MENESSKFIMFIFGNISNWVFIFVVREFICFCFWEIGNLEETISLLKRRNKGLKELKMENDYSKLQFFYFFFLGGGHICFCLKK